MAFIKENESMARWVKTGAHVETSMLNESCTITAPGCQVGMGWEISRRASSAL
jgi:hypothetical protein